MKKSAIAGLAAGLIWAAASGAAAAEDLQGEIINLSGSVAVVRSGGAMTGLKEGDTVGVGDTIKVMRGGEAVLALDGDMKNIVQISEGTELTVNSLYPTELEITKGDVLSKLQALPSGSTFQITTPNGTAAVRGSEFRTVYGDEGMEVFNIEHSNVYVFHREADGKIAETPVIVPQSQKTAVTRRGTEPAEPKPIPAAQLNMTQLKEKQMMKGVERRIASGLPPKIPRMDALQRVWRDKAKGEGGGRHPMIEKQDRMMQGMDGADRGMKPGEKRMNQGPKGPDGPRGPKDHRGEMGNQGPDGPRGPMDGLRGPDGGPHGEAMHKPDGDGPHIQQPGSRQPEGGEKPQGGGKRPAAPRPAPRRAGP